MRLSKETWDIFQERESRSNQANDFPGLGPHVAWVVGCCLLSSDGERLTGEASRNDVNHALVDCCPSLINECSDIAEDWGVVEVAISYPLRQHALAVVIELDVANCGPAE
jgi:hypothetical protein